ncbi:MAG: alpha-2-macroglobulin family protein, partial [Armatimonadota bacterium]
VLAQGRTDVSGTARFALPRDATEFFLVAVAQRGPDEAVVGRTDYRFESSGEFTLHAYTDRPIYRPGHRIHYKAIARRNASGGFGYSVPAGQTVSIEIRDPSGEPILREQRRTNAYGSFAGHVDLSAEAATGTYALVLAAGGSTVTHDIVVAAYRKPEYSVTVTPEKPRYARGETVSMTVSAQYYFGAPVAGAKVTYSVYRAQDWVSTYIARYDLDPDELDWYRRSSGDGRIVIEGETQLDERGRAVITFRADAPDEPYGPQDQSFTAQVAVRDPSGRETSGEGVAAVVAGEFRLWVETKGFLVTPGAPTQVIVTAEDYDKKPVPGVRIELEAAYERWNPAKREAFLETAVKQTATTGSDGKATIDVTIPGRGFGRLIARARDSKGRTVAGETFLCAIDDSGAELQIRYAELSLLTDKRRYMPGDVARVLINTDRVGQTALLTIEGSQIHKVMPVPITRRSTVVNIPILNEYGTQVFLSALYVKEKRLATSEVALRVANPESELQVSIQSDRPRYGPGDKATYSVEIRDARGRPQQAEFSFGVVDESIYALLEDDPKALRNAFYPRRWNQVRTSYSFALTYLGDAEKAEPNIALRRRFLDTAHWEPALQTDAQGKATVTVVLPDNLTTWRATAVAHTTDTKLGRTIQKVIASKDFLVRVETPRLLTQNDRSRILVLVHNETDVPQQTTVRLLATGLTVEGDHTQTLSLQPHKVGQAAWPVVAREMGTAKIRATAWTSGREGRQYTDGIELSIPVRPHGRQEITSAAGEVTADQPKTETLTLNRAAIPGATRLTLRITPSVTSSVVEGLEYLIGYPYGCVEQTMSRFLPTVMVQRALRVSGIQNRYVEEAAPTMVRDGLARLYRFQHESGGWGWWEFDDDHPWMTAYVLYGLATARSMGYPVSDAVLQRGREAALALAKPAAGTWGWTMDTQMFLLYAIALAGDLEPARAMLPGVNPKDLGPQGLAYMVLTEKLLGRNPRAAFAELGRRAVSENGVIHWDSDEGSRWWSWDWNDRMSTSTALRAILAVNRKDARVGSILRYMMLSRTGGYWWSTRDTSWALAALADYISGERGAAAVTGEIRVGLNGQVLQTYGLTPASATAPDIVLDVPSTALRPGKNDVTLERVGGSSRVFYSIQLRQTVAMEEIPALASSNIKIEREYLRVLPRRVGQDSWTTETVPAGNRLSQGDRVMVRLTVTTPRDLAYILIEDPFPSGFEVTERGSAEMDEWSYWWASTDVRDDRIAFFIRSLPAGTHVIEYNLRAQTPGTFHALPAILQGMYAPQTRGESAGARVVIK